MYGICLLPIMLIFLSVGSALVYFIQVVSEEHIEEQCPKIIDYAKDQYFANQEDTGLTQEEMDNMNVYDLTLINTFMCTDVCPCKDVATKNEWLDIPTEELNEKWPKQLDLKAVDELTFNFNGEYTSYQQCVEAATDPLD